MPLGENKIPMIYIKYRRGFMEKYWSDWQIIYPSTLLKLANIPSIVCERAWISFSF
jgi:hypothetical protein